jgi:S-adenosylmethionine decarboxylase
VDASTYNRRNLTSTDAVFSLFESIARNLDMTLVIPPIVCRYPFANSELETFCDDVEQERKKKIAELGEDARPDLDLNLTPVAVMRQSLKKRQMEDSGVTGVAIWAESHCAIHTWDEDNYFSFDAFSCTNYNPADAIRLLLNTFDIEMLNCVDLFAFPAGHAADHSLPDQQPLASSSRTRRSGIWTPTISTERPRRCPPGGAVISLLAGCWDHLPAHPASGSRRPGQCGRSWWLPGSTRAGSLTAP